MNRTLNESLKKLGPPEPYDPKNPEHSDPTKYVLYQGTVWDHMIAALKTNKLVDPIVNLAILLHDCAKPVTATIRDHGGTAYFGHAEEGVRLVNDIADRLKLSNDEREKLIFAVGNHMKFHLILDMKPSKIAKLVSDDNWDVLVAVAMADNYSRGKDFKYNIDFEHIVDRAIEVKEKWGQKAMNNVIKVVSGDHIMEITGLKPSKMVGNIIKSVTDFVIDNNINPSNKTEMDNIILQVFKELQ